MINYTIFSKIPVEAASDERLTKTHFRILIALLSFYNHKTGKCNPSRTQISNVCKIRETTISLATTELENLGWLKKDGRGGNSLHCSYEIMIPLEYTVPEQRTVKNDETVREPRTPTVREPRTPTVREPRTRTIENRSINRPSKQNILSNKVVELEIVKNKEVKVTQEKGNKNEDVTKVFEHWKEKLKHPQAKLDDDRKRIIEKTIKTYGIETALNAITGCSMSEYHLGKNKEGKIYDGLSLIFRNAENIERFEGYFLNPSTKDKSFEDTKKEFKDWVYAEDQNDSSNIYDVEYNVF